ncbi:MAG: VWA domain-containing protein [Porticoccaceae bacterium]|nr:VWA domain-containing protein [Porticoccaceae bacterium]
MSDLLANLGDFHFLRPWWFLGLVPVFLVLGLYQWHKRSAGNWEQIINPALLPFLLQGEDKTNKQAGWLLSGLGMAWVICCFSLAGPTWQQLPQPVHKEDSAMVVVFDLSPSMLAEDITPSRLVRGRYKLIDILKNRREGFVGLVVYGGEAHTVSPLTEDSNTIISLVPILHPTLLPEYGSNTEEAIEMAIELAINGGYEQADIVLISDGVSRAAFGTIQSMVAKAGNYRLSILGVGTNEGAPIPLGNSGFVKDRSGNILIPKLDASSLQMLANKNGGIYRDLSADDSDIDALLKVAEQAFPNATRELDRSFDLWDDQGFWLIILFIPALILSFRRGTVVLILIAPLLSVSDQVTASIWQDLWQNPDQQGLDALDAGDAATAQSLFEDSQWRGSAAYRAGDYENAIGEFTVGNTADAHYNRGNALARSGELEAAVKAYDRALELQPDMKDAQANRELVEKLKQQQEQKQNGDQSEQDKQQDKEQNQEQESDQQQQSNDDQQSQQQESPSDEQREQEPDSAEDKEQEQSEEKSQEQEQEENQQQEQEQEQQLEEQELSKEEKQNQQEIEQMLRRVPDDPGGLLREKFRYQSRQRALEQRRPKPPNEQERW